MALQRSAKIKLGLLGLAVAGFAIDRGLVFSGGSEANAQALPGGPAATTPASAEQKKAAAAPTIEVAKVLESLRQDVTEEQPDRDAFRLPEALSTQPAPETGLPVPVAVSEPKADQPVAQVPVTLPSFEVTSIIAASTSNPMAVINGTPIRVGQTRQGITLVSVSSRVATIRYADQLVEVRLSDAR